VLVETQNPSNQNRS